MGGVFLAVAVLALAASAAGAHHHHTSAASRWDEDMPAATSSSWYRHPLRHHRQDAPPGPHAGSAAGGSGLDQLINRLDTLNRVESSSSPASGALGSSLSWKPRKSDRDENRVMDELRLTVEEYERGDVLPDPKSPEAKAEAHRRPRPRPAADAKHKHGHGHGREEDDDDLDSMMDEDDKEEADEPSDEEDLSDEEDDDDDDESKEADKAGRSLATSELDDMLGYKDTAQESQSLNPSSEGCGAMKSELFPQSTVQDRMGVPAGG
ncbi:hypothetical protein ONE63_004639 [Megalurothrips usitatus]|uniref:Uncharacterized protein n=1 Tax=Megalurothrips usitatus TaxID=439358 RepID=A0AAV7X457_9NEOP|nr:hypothetical protein ONE63_004639 [Megalurothrips usitatus]